MVWRQREAIIVFFSLRNVIVSFLQLRAIVFYFDMASSSLQSGLHTYVCVL